jgi:hypothetical protein
MNAPPAPDKAFDGDKDAKAERGADRGAFPEDMAEAKNDPRAGDDRLMEGLGGLAKGDVKEKDAAKPPPPAAVPAAPPGPDGPLVGRAPGGKDGADKPGAPHIRGGADKAPGAADLAKVVDEMAKQNGNAQFQDRFGGVAKKLPREEQERLGMARELPDARFIQGGPNFGFDQAQRRLEAMKRMDGKASRPAALPPMVVREYAHRRSAEPTSAAGRSDWAETVYWHPALVMPDGKIDVGFDLSDATTTFQATVFAHSADGRLGAVTARFDSRLPLSLKPTLPVEVTSSDRIDLPVSVLNNTPEDRDVRLTLTKHDGLELVNGAADQACIAKGGAAVRQTYRLRPTLKEGKAVVGLAGQTGAFQPDKREDAFRIAPEGFPVAESRSDLLEGSATQTVRLPDSWVKDTLKCRVQVYPSTLADLQSGLDSLLREPNGCFEQTSTSNYPNLLILDYLQQSGQAKPEVERKARDLLARGYQKLTSFECTNTSKNAKEGYEWFGGAAPAHEALTAYGLMQFRDMARVQDVDPTMLRRTRDYLASRRDGKGGFLRNPKSLDSFGHAPADVTNAYIVWALTEAGKDDDVTKELDALAAQAKSSKDPYFLSLTSIALVNRGRRDEATPLLKAVAAAQKDDGHLDAEKTSITGSGGRDLQIETTALAVLGWLKANNPAEFQEPVRKAVAWVGKQRGGYGGFGSTQSTILALKALIEYTRENKRTAAAGELHLFVGGQEAARLAFPAGAAEALTLDVPGAESCLKPGNNEVRVEITGKNVFPYTLSWTYQTLRPASAEDCPVRLETALAKADAAEGENVRLTATVKNVADKGQSMAVAVIGLPGGMTLPEDFKQLKDYCKTPEDGSRSLVSAFEVRGRELVLYWRDLAPNQQITVPIDLVCRVPGEFSGPASRAYLYYNADHKHWVEPLHVHIGIAE